MVSIWQVGRAHEIFLKLLMFRCDQNLFYTNIKGPDSMISLCIQESEGDACWLWKISLGNFLFAIFFLFFFGINFLSAIRKEEEEMHVSWDFFAKVPFHNFLSFSQFPLDNFLRKTKEMHVGWDKFLWMISISEFSRDKFLSLNQERGGDACWLG